MGRNGAGKTTLTLDGKDVTNWPPNRRAMGGIGTFHRSVRSSPISPCTRTC